MFFTVPGKRLSSFHAGRGMRRRRALLPAIAVTALAAAAATGCGSSGSSSPASTTGTKSSTSSASSDTSKAIATARAELAPYRAGQTELPLTVALKAPPERGKTIVVTNCGAPACTQNNTAIQAAAKRVGWNVKILPFDYANPATLVKALTTALQYHPAAVVPVALPVQTWASAIPMYRAAKVPIIAEGMSSPVPASARDVIVASTPPTQSIFPSYGKALADWMIVDSNASAQVLLQTTPEFGPFTEYTSRGVKSTFDRLCPKCSTIESAVTVSQLQDGSANGIVVSALRKHPNLKYVFLPNAQYGDGLRSSLNAAGLKDVKIVAISADTQDLRQLKTGGFSAGVVFSISFTADMTFDAALRATEHSPIPSYDGVQAAQLLDAENIDSISKERIDLSVPPDYDYLSAWAKLWHAG